MIALLSTIVSLAIVEILLSIDNALVNATLAEELPEEKRRFAIRVGIILGALFRVVALFFATLIIENVWVKALGGAYLVYLAISHLAEEGEGTTGHSFKKHATTLAVITQIAIADMVFSIDNVISAVSFTESKTLVIFGVLAGIFGMLVITPFLSRVIHKYPKFTTAAYVIVGLIGIFLLVETWTHFHISEFNKFITIMGILYLTYLIEKHEHLERKLVPFFKKSIALVSMKHITRLLK